MRGQLTGDDLFAEILLLRDQGKVVVLVEGPDDMGVLDPHICEEGAYLIPGYGKSSVEYVIDQADALDLAFVLAILDRDWVDIAEDAKNSPNVVYSDLYDLDATVISSGDVCRRVVGSFCDMSGLRRHVARTGVQDFIHFAIQPSLAIGVLRLISHEQGLELSVRNFPVAQVMDVDGGPVDIKRMILIAVSKSASHEVNLDEVTLAESITGRISQITNPLRYCSGHDLATALSVVMRQRWDCHVRASVIVKAIRAAFSCADLMSTQLYRDVERWAEGRNTTIWTCRRAVAS